MVFQITPKARLRKTKAELFGRDWVLSRVGKSVWALKLLDLAAPVCGHEGTDQRGDSRAQVWATQNAVHEFTSHSCTRLSPGEGPVARACE